MIPIQISFLDEDEVGDRITVRSDEELKAMLSYVSIYRTLVLWVVHLLHNSIADNIKTISS